MAAPKNHAFVVPAYGHSPHLRECLTSLQAQNCGSPIHICTSTPYDGIAELASSYAANLHVHGPNRGIGHDWNTALLHTPAEWITLAHQDDIYLPDFGSRTLAAIERYPRAALVFTDYGECVGEVTRASTSMLIIKRALLELGFMGREAVAARGAKRRTLRFGCAIPCPSVTLRRRGDGALFREDLRLNLDWEAWLRLANGEGEFVYLRGVAMLHRIHAGSETSAGVSDGVRAREDRMMFEAQWPRPIAALLARVYAASYEIGH